MEAQLTEQTDSLISKSALITKLEAQLALSDEIKTQNQELKANMQKEQKSRSELTKLIETLRQDAANLRKKDNSFTEKLREEI